MDILEKVFKNFWHSPKNHIELPQSAKMTKRSILKWDDDVVYEIVIALEALPTSFKNFFSQIHCDLFSCVVRETRWSMKRCSVRREHTRHKQSLSVNKKNWDVEETKMKLKRFKKSSWVVDDLIYDVRVKIWKFLWLEILWDYFTKYMRKSFSELWNGKVHVWDGVQRSSAGLW